MPEKPRRLRILEACQARLEAIDGDADARFVTTLGRKVWFGELPTLGEDDPDVALAMIPREDIIQWDLNNIKIQLPIDVFVIVKPTRSEAWALIEQGLADVKTAMEIVDATLDDLLVHGRDSIGLSRGTTEIFPRQSGSTVTGASITYLAPYVEAKGSPRA